MTLVSMLDVDSPGTEKTREGSLSPEGVKLKEEAGGSAGEGAWPLPGLFRSRSVWFDFTRVDTD